MKGCGRRALTLPRPAVLHYVVAATIPKDVWAADGLRI
jgi:hypothetical protein